MPGIAGIIGKGSNRAHQSDVKHMLEAMRHEEFYGHGFYSVPDLGVHIGWTSYSESNNHHVFAVSEPKDVMIVLAGEHFSSVPEAKERGADYLLRRYLAEGDSFIRDLNGWFAGLLVDVRKSTVSLFNDRYGMHRIYWHEGKAEFLFASEAKALLKVRSQLRELDYRGLGELISCNCVLENRTLFPKIALLPGGAVWTWKNGGELSRDAYFRPQEWEDLPALDPTAFLSRLDETSKAIMPRYFGESGQVGISITGGLDSRMIMGCLDPKPGTLPCYTFGGAKDVLDITIAKQVAELYGQYYQVIRIGPGFFSDFPRLAEKTVFMADGNLDVCCTHDMYFNELARKIAPVRVTGKFGSEVIRDHSMFHASRYNGELFCPEMNSQFSQALMTFEQVKKGHPLSVAVFRDFPWREYNKVALERSQVVFRSPYMDNDLVQLMYQAPAGLRSTNYPQRDIIRRCNPSLSAITSDRGYGEQTNAIAAKLIELYFYVLFKVDYIYLFATPHWLTRLDTFVMSLNGERQLLGSQKFDYYRIWFRRELADYVRDILLDKRTLSRPHFNGVVLEKMLQAHVNGTHNYMNEINRALSIELTQRVLIDA